VNIPLQNAPSSTLGFITSLPLTNSILNSTPLPPPPPPPCEKDDESKCPR